MLQYILFDLDGTLTESGRGVINGAKHALKHFGITPPADEALAVFIGPPLKESFMRFYGMDESKALEAVEAYREYYHATGVYENALYPGISALLQALCDDGFLLAVSSSKAQKMVEIVLDYFSVSKFFSLVIGGTDSGARYTKAGVIAETLRLFAERDGRTVEEVRERAVMVGDRKQDIEGAKENGLRTIGVSWGYAPEGELQEAGADFIVSGTEEFTALVRKMKTAEDVDNSAGASL